MNKLIANLRKRIAGFFYQTQEFTLWLPGLVLLSVVGFVVLGAITRVTGDSLAWLAELPVLCAYAAAALAFSWLIKYLYLHDLDREAELRLHAAAERGDMDAQWLLTKDRLETLACVLAMLVFFFPAR